MPTERCLSSARTQTDGICCWASWWLWRCQPVSLLPLPLESEALSPPFFNSGASCKIQTVNWHFNASHSIIVSCLHHCRGSWSEYLWLLQSHLIQERTPVTPIPVAEKSQMSVGVGGFFVRCYRVNIGRYAGSKNSTGSRTETPFLKVNSAG